MSVLQRSQSGRLDDQRGTLINDLEMPEFLKVTCSTPLNHRAKPISTSAGSSPLHSKYVGSYPASPVTIDRRMNFPFEEQLESRLNSSINSGFYSVTSWKEIESPDRELIDKAYASEACFETLDEKTIITDNAYSLELSKSQPSLIEGNQKQKIKICKENSSPLSCEGISQDISTNIVDNRRTPKFPFPDDINSNTKNKNQDNTRITKMSKEESLAKLAKPKTAKLEKPVIPKKPENFNRPKSITNYLEKEVLKGLEKDGYEIISANETKKTKEKDATETVSHRCNNENSDSRSPNGKSDFRTDNNSVFHVNAVATPDKSRLLKGETVLSKKNEKITFV